MIVFLVPKDKPDQRYNQFKFDESIFSAEKPVQEISRIDRVIDVREGTTRNWHNMVHDYEIYCESAKHDLKGFYLKLMKNSMKL